MNALLQSVELVEVEWTITVLLIVVVTTSVLPVSVHAGLALAHDALPFALSLSALVLVHSVWSGMWVLAGCSFALLAAHATLVLPRLLSEQAPRWAAHAPRIDIVACNVYIKNAKPHAKARQLVACGADVLVLAKWNPSFAAAFTSAGGDDHYPHRLVDQNDQTDYSVCIASRRPYRESRIVNQGPLKLAHVAVPCGSRELQILGLNASAIVDRGGYKLWKVQLRSLIAHVPMLQTPAVLAGDFNTTRFRPEFRSLLRAGLTDAHDALGKGLSTSFKLAATGVLAAAGMVVRLDHALLTRGVCAIDAENLDACGSDHLPFRVTLAVRQPHRVTTTVARHGLRLHRPFALPIRPVFNRGPAITTRKGYL
jgi:endonuclease/exonuclease/phosphatase (EEP) superfamily protein YafD